MFPFLELAAVAASALYGVLRGAREQFDFIGLLAISFVTAFGGGTLRDVLLDRRPLYWVEKEYTLWLVIALALVGAVTPRRVARVQGLLLFPDALGLGLYSVAGAVVAIEAGATPLIAVVMGLVTGTFGGVLSDIICNETPTLFKSSPLCATCSIVGVVAYLASWGIGAPSWTAQSIGVVVVTVLRLLAVSRDWRVPVRVALTES